MKTAFVLATAFVLGCSGGDAKGGANASQLSSPSGGTPGQPTFCGYATELRDLPMDGCDFSGVCKIKVAYYCEMPQAATRKKYDCQCVDGAYSCTATEFGLSLDPTCNGGHAGM